MSESAVSAPGKRPKWFELRSVDSRRTLVGQLFWFLLWLGVTTVAMVLSPDPHSHGTHQQLGLPACPSVIAFHRPCPGCGLTTSFTAMVHGDFAAAFRANMFGPVLYVLFTASALVCGWGWLRKVRFDTDTKAFNIALGVLVGMFLAYGGARFALMDNYKPHPAYTNAWERKAS